MKQILQALDKASSRKVEGANDMRRFVSIVQENNTLKTVSDKVSSAVDAAKEKLSDFRPYDEKAVAKMYNVKTANNSNKKEDQATPPSATAPAQPQVDPKNYKVPSVEFLKKNYKHPADIIKGASPSTTDPTRIGAFASGSDFDELVMALSGSNYRSAKADPKFRPVQVKDDWEYVQRLLGTPEGKEYAVDNWIGLSDVNDKSPEAEFNRAQHKEFEKQANARISAQKDNVIKPGWKYDQSIGMTPAYQRSVQAQQPPATEGKQSFLDYLTLAEEKQKGVDGKACWDGYKRMGTKKKGGKTVDNCVPTGKK